jgi:hypothetical protein
MKHDLNTGTAHLPVDRERLRFWRSELSGLGPDALIASHVALS